MREERNVPKLRFPKFMDDWETVELSNVTNKISVGIATEVRPYVSQLKEVPILRNQNIKAGYFDDSDIEYITKEFDETNRTKRVKANDLLIVRTGSNIGNACVVPLDYENSQTFTTLIVRPSSSALNSEFLSQHVNFKGLSEIARLSAGAGKPNLNAGFLKRYRISIPGLEEQQKIAEFLTAVDKRIELLQAKKEKLEAYKKGVMQKIFPSTGSGTPQLRFKADDGSDFPDWEERKLGDLGSVYQPKTISQSDLTEEGYDVFGANGIIGKYHSYNHEFPQVAVTCRGNTCGTVNWTNPKSWITGNAMVVNTDENPSINKRYLFHILTFTDLKYLITGSGQPQITGDLKNHKLQLPSIEEQEKIVAFLTSLDRSIENLNQQINQTQTWKKGLLQKMFV